MRGHISREDELGVQVVLLNGRGDQLPRSRLITAPNIDVFATPGAGTYAEVHMMLFQQTIDDVLRSFTSFRGQRLWIADKRIWLICSKVRRGVVGASNCQ